MADLNVAIFKKYKNRKIYCPKSGRYVSAKEIFQTILAGYHVAVFDVGTGLDVTAKTVMRYLADSVPDGVTITPELANYIDKHGGLVGAVEQISGHRVTSNIAINKATVEAFTQTSGGYKKKKEAMEAAEEEVTVAVKAIRAMKLDQAQTVLPAPEGR